MTPQRFAEIGALLYGYSWHKPLGIALDVARRNIMRWADGSADIPAGIPAELATLCENKAVALFTAAKQIRNGSDQ